MSSSKSKPPRPPVRSHRLLIAGMVAAVVLSGLAVVGALGQREPLLETWSYGQFRRAWSPARSARSGSALGP